jgi:hypothetical protein
MIVIYIGDDASALVKRRTTATNADLALAGSIHSFGDVAGT